MAAIASILFALAVFLTVGGGGGEGACDNVPSMSIDEACTKACANVISPRFEVCQSTLARGGLLANANVADFTVAAAMTARDSYELSMRKVNETLENPALKREERRSFDDCQRKYGEAHESMERAINQIPGCYYSSAPQEFIDASASVWSCGNGLMEFQSSPLYAMNLADQELTMLAYHLGDLILN